SVTHGGIHNARTYLPFRPTVEGLAWIDREAVRFQVIRARGPCRLAALAPLPEAQRSDVLNGRSEPTAPPQGTQEPRSESKRGPLPPGHRRCAPAGVQRPKPRLRRSRPAASPRTSTSTP